MSRLASGSSSYGPSKPMTAATATSTRASRATESQRLLAERRVGLASRRAESEEASLHHATLAGLRQQRTGLLGQNRAPRKKPSRPPEICSTGSKACSPRALSAGSKLSVAGKLILHPDRNLLACSSNWTDWRPRASVRRPVSGTGSPPTPGARSSQHEPPPSRSSSSARDFAANAPTLSSHRSLAGSPFCRRRRGARPTQMCH